MTAKSTVRRLVRSRGWEVRRITPDLTIDTYLWYLLPHFGIDLVVDVGGRCGEFGCLLRDNDYRGHIVSFEPVSSNFAALEGLCARDARWDAYRYALGAADTTAPINVSRHTSYTSFRDVTSDARAVMTDIDVVGTESVPVRRLDGLFAEVTAHVPDAHVFLKIDTQGWDLEVLEGASGCLDRVIAVQTEVSLNPLYEGIPPFETTLAAFRDRGFEMIAMFPAARLGAWRLAELDCVLLRRELTV
jgi:FkbM family methyltransferase